MVSKPSARVSKSVAMWSASPHRSSATLQSFSARAVERDVFGERGERALLLPAGVVARQRRHRVEVRENDVRGAEGGGGEPARAGSRAQF